MHDLTIGVEFGIRTITVDGKRIKIQIWDTAGCVGWMAVVRRCFRSTPTPPGVRPGVMVGRQDSFRSITRSYYRGAAGVLLVYDITRKSSFDHLASWLDDLHMHGGSDMVITLVGNKCDLEDSRQVPREMGQKFADKYNLNFIEASAKTSAQVEEAFVSTAEKIFHAIQAGSLDLRKDNNGIKLGPEFGNGDAAGAASKTGAATPKEGGCC